MRLKGQLKASGYFGEHPVAFDVPITLQLHAGSHSLKDVIQREAYSALIWEICDLLDHAHQTKTTYATFSDEHSKAVFLFDVDIDDGVFIDEDGHKWNAPGFYSEAYVAPYDLENDRLQGVVTA